MDEHRLESFLINQIYRTGDIGDYFDTTVTFGDPFEKYERSYYATSYTFTIWGRTVRARIKKFYNTAEDVLLYETNEFFI